MLPDKSKDTYRWKKKFTDRVMRQHLTGAWVAVVLDPLWCVSDYFIIPGYWKIFLAIRLFVAGITLGAILLRKKLNISHIVIIFIPFLGIALQNAYMYSVMDVETLYKHTFAYIALFIGAGMFVIWKPVYSVIVVSLTLLGNIILFRLYSHLTLEEILINGGMLTATVAVFSILLSQARYRTIRKEVISKLELEDSHAEILAQKNVIEKSKGELEEINNKLKRFAHVVSHDLKAPLRGITNLAQWVKEEVADKAGNETRLHLELLQGQSEKMNNLIDGILEYSKTNEINLVAEYIETDGLLKDVVQRFTLKHGDRIVIAPGMPAVYQNRTRMIQVFQNLISNAIKYNDKEAVRIHIYCIDKNDCYEFAVEDNGPGIAPEYHEKIFELFQVLHHGGTDSTGVGLSIVKKIIEETGGRIWIESSPGNGAAFRFTLPKTQEPQVKKEETGFTDMHLKA